MNCVPAAFSAENQELSNESFTDIGYDIDAKQPELFVYEKGLLTPLLISSAGSLEAISLTASSFSILEDEVWKRVARHFKELNLCVIDLEFPFDGVLQTCHALRKLSLTFDDGCEVRRHLELVAERVSKVTELKLGNAYWLGNCTHVWLLLRCLETLEIEFGQNKPAPPADTIYSEYEGIADPNSRLGSLTLNIIRDGEDYFFAALDLCQRIGHTFMNSRFV